MEKIALSTVTPVYCGEKYLKNLVNELEKVRNFFSEKELPIELVESIFVDDGSIDNSYIVLKELEKQYSWIRIISLSRNYGQHSATIAGLLYSSGDWVATLDEDLQHHPCHLFEMLSKVIVDNFDVLYAKPIENVHKSLFRDISSKLYKSSLAKITGISHIKNFNSFRLIRGSIARSTASVCSHDSYFDVVLCWFTNRIGILNLPLKDIRYIENKKSGYNFFKLISHARKLMVSSHTKLLRLGATIGIFAMLISLFTSMIILYRKIFTLEISIQGWTSLMIVILFFGGLISFVLGIVLEYVSILLLKSQGKPTFFVIDRSKDSFWREAIERVNTSSKK